MKKKSKRKKQKKPVFNDKEMAILRFVGKSRGAYLSFNEVARGTGISWVTCKKYIDKLYNDGLIAKWAETKKGKKRTYQRKPKFRLNFKEIYGD